MLNLSIVVPFRNAKKFIDQFINSVKEQKVQPKEVIFIDDSSDDGGYEYLKEKYLSDNFKIIHAQERLYPGGARNLGVKSATGEYIYFMDIDDSFVDKNSLLHLQQVISSKPDVVCVSFIIDHGKNKNIVTAKMTLKDAPYGPVGPWAQVFKRDLYVEMPEHTLSEDSPWHFLQFDKFSSFARIQEPFYRWNRTNDEQITFTVDFCGKNSITLETYALQNILVTRNLRDQWVSDILRNLANMYDIRNKLTKPNVKDAWKCRFLGQYKNMMTGHFIH